MSSPISLGPDADLLAAPREASSLEILCLRIIGSLVFIFGYLAAKGRLGELSGVVRGLRSDRPLALLLVGAAFFSSANWLVNIVE
ncbi:hypothetical protein MESMUL_23110 [Mesosutterella multiformis]|uniref:Uncharacterized protein n=1 Tax=Mesosutterella multiformis TaxID=2259133 RepID=A0A388SF07_9BURK|nr:hypothetical protein [Mesosutterella multiformis]GBO94957.1 hypothetical protein MESMUL_23110 [Mesosutterella multiformis]